MSSASVVIASRNGARTLPEALASIAAQEFDGEVEVLLADNGSTDATRAVFEDFARRNPRFGARVIDASAQPGKAFALNLAIAQATGDRFLFLDDDDAWGPGYLRAMDAALSQHPFVAAGVDCRTLNHPDLYPLRAHEETPKKRPDFAPESAFASGGAQGFRREMAEVVGPYRNDLGSLEDIDFCIRAGRAGYRLVTVPDARYLYRYRADAAGVYRQHRGYSAAWVAVRGFYGGESRAFSPLAWASLGRRYLELAIWRALRLHRRLTRYEAHRYAMLRGEADGQLEGAIKTGYPPNDRTLRRLLRRIGRRLQRLDAAARAPRSDRGVPDESGVRPDQAKSVAPDL